MILLDGKIVSDKIKTELKDLTIKIPPDAPELSILLGTSGGGELAYSNAIKKKATELGLNASVYTETAGDNFLQKLKALSNSKNTGAIIVQRPYPEGVKPEDIHSILPPQKDIDGASFEMMGRLLSDEPAYYPATAEAILILLKHYDCPLEGKNAVIIGRSISVGKPVSLLLLKNNATITICHSRTENIKEITNSADIIVIAVGIKHFLKEDMVSKNAWVVDVGYNYDSEGGPYGDCDFNALKDKVHAITPVPGGVGPVTTATLLYNAVKAIKKFSF